MEDLLTTGNGAAIARWQTPETFSPLTPEDFARHDPDAHWVAPRGKLETAARCSLWWRSVPLFSGHRLGIIGHYAARDNDAARELLAHGCAELRASGRLIFSNH